MYKISYVSLILFISFAFNSMAQVDYSGNIKVEQSVLTQQNDVKVNLDIILDKLDIKSDHMLLLTPVIQSKDKQRQQELPQIVVVGRRKAKAVKRTMLLDPQNGLKADNDTIVKRKNGTMQTIPYRVSVPLQDWMKSGELFLTQDVVGCAHCNLSNSQMMLCSPLIAQYQANFIVPEMEKAKVREESIELHLIYKVGDWNIDPNLANNRSELNKIENLYNQVSNNKDLTIKDIYIVGYSSPEGTFDLNMKVSQKRAESAADYIQNNLKVDKSIIRTSWKGEDWNGLAAIIEESNIQYKEKILEIIRTTDVIEMREAEIMRLDGGNTYRQLLKDVFPKLRKNGCTIHFIMAEFDQEKAKAQFKTNPKLLSIDEIYRLSNLYAKDSEEYKNIWLQTADAFPDSEIATVNAAAVAINMNETDKAMQLLDKVKNMPEAFNNIGIIMARQGKYDEAKNYFTKASQNGVPEASINLSQLNKSVTDSEKE